MSKLQKLKNLDILFDYYGDLLTKNQRQIFESYYHYDKSICEISEINKVSRQTISENLKVIRKNLFEYEKKIEFYSSKVSIQKNIKKVIEYLNKNDKINKNKVIEKLSKIIED